MRRKSFKGADCPVARALDVIGDWWSLLIIRDAFDGISRFSDFQINLGIAKNILSERLQMLVERGVLEVTPASDGSAFQEYRLTEMGNDLFYIIVTIRQWGERHLFNPKEKHSILIEKANGVPVQTIKLKGKDGSRLKPSDTLVKKVKR